MKTVNADEKFEEIYAMVLINKNNFVEIYDPYQFQLLVIGRNGVIVVSFSDKMTFDSTTRMIDGCSSTKQMSIRLEEATFRHLYHDFKLENKLSFWEGVLLRM